MSFDSGRLMFAVVQQGYCLTTRTLSAQSISPNNWEDIRCLRIAEADRAGHVCACADQLQRGFISANALALDAGHCSHLWRTPVVVCKLHRALQRLALDGGGTILSAAVQALLPLGWQLGRMAPSLRSFSFETRILPFIYWETCCSSS